MRQNDEGEIEKEWQTRHAGTVASHLTAKERSDTWVERAGLGQAMRNFLQVHEAALRPVGSRQEGAHARFVFADQELNSIVEGLKLSTGLGEEIFYLSHDLQGNAHFRPSEHAVKVRNQNAIPAKVYHASSLTAGLAALVTGHLLAGPDPNPKGVY